MSNGLTPGPWFTNTSTTHNGRDVYAYDPNREGNWYVGHISGAANGDLVSLAPEMREAILAENHTCMHPSVCDWCQLVAKLRQVGSREWHGTVWAESEWWPQDHPEGTRPRTFTGGPTHSACCGSDPDEEETT